MGTTLFKEAKTADDFTQVEGEFKQAADLAPQWPEARYNLALTKEAAGDYSGATADLKLYQQFKLSESEARTVQDTIYALEAKAVAAEKRQAAKQESDDKQREQRIVDLQKRFPELIVKLEESVFVGTYFNDRCEILFSKKPFTALTNTTRQSTPFLWRQEMCDNKYLNPGAVIPTSADIFYVTSGQAPTSLHFDYSTFAHKGDFGFTANKWTLSDDGQTLTTTYDYTAGAGPQKPYVFYLTKKR